MAFEADKNPYYEETVNTFKDCFSRKKIMESDFRPDMIQEYADLSKELIKSAAELLKLGVSRKLDREIVVFHVDNTEYPVQKKDILKEIGEKQWNVLFPIEELENIADEKDEDEDIDTLLRNEYQYENMTKGMYGRQMNPLAMANPFGAFLSAIFAPFMGMQGYQQPYQAPVQATVPTKEESKAPSSGSDILDDISGLHRKIVLLEKERDSAQDSIALVKQKYEELKKDSTEKKELLEKEKSELDEKIKENEEKISSMEKELNAVKKSSAESENSSKNLISQLQEQKNKLQGELNSVRQNLENLKKEKEHINSQLQNNRSSAEKAKQESDKIISDLKNELENVKKASAEEIKKLNNKAAEDLKAAVEKTKDEYSSKAQEDGKNTDRRIQELERKINEYKERSDKDNKRLEETQNRIKNLQNEKDSLKAESERLSAENKKLEEQLENASNQDTEKENFYKELEKKCEELKVLAYTDIKTKVMNLNAFNRDLPVCDKNNTIIAMVGIRNMKSINAMHGRGSGDKVIGIVAEKLISIYQKENVYRILGDQFVVLINGGMLSNIQSQLASVHQNLMAQNIDIAYGIAMGNASDNIGNALAMAEESMKSMKSAPQGMQAAGEGYQNPSSSQPMNMGYQMPPSETTHPVVDNTPRPEEIDINNILLEYMNSQN
jgi:GGDEF domain-containing protein